MFLLVLVSVQCDEDSPMEASERSVIHPIHRPEHVFVQAPKKDPEPVVEVPDHTCRWGQAVYEEGKVIWRGFHKHTCMAGQWQIIARICCMYVDAEGQTQRAFPGDTYNNGCNEAVCRSNGLGVVRSCDPDKCEDKCEYKNWDGVEGYAEVGREDVQVHDDCPRTCTCEANDDGPRIGKCSRCVL